MRDHFEALTDRLTAAGHLVFLVEAPGDPKLPYLLIEPVSWAGWEQAVCGRQDHLDVQVRVKAVAALPGVAMDRLTRAQGVLSPDGLPERLPVEGRDAWTSWVRHEADYFDQQVIVPGSNNTHLALSVDTYRLASAPA